MGNLFRPGTVDTARRTPAQGLTPSRLTKSPTKLCMLRVMSEREKEMLRAQKKVMCLGIPQRYE